MMSVNKEELWEALRTVQDPELHEDLISLGMVKGLEVEGDRVSVAVELTTPACPLKNVIRQSVEEAIRKIKGVGTVEVKMTASVRTPEFRKNNIPGIKNIVAVASGKGGVGKTTVSVNLSLALASQGAKVGLMDADIYGPNVPQMMGVSGPLRTAAAGKIIPFESHGVRVMSMGFLIAEGKPVIWRGPMLHGAVRQFLNDVDWGGLDYLVVDLPPGTGDVQLSLSQIVPLTGAVVVTTPQKISLMDVRRGISMFRETGVPILGIVENMSYFLCPQCRERTEIFSHGGGRETAENLKVPFLGELPLDIAVRKGGDGGAPIVISDPGSETARQIFSIAGRLAAEISVNTYHSQSDPASACQSNSGHPGGLS